MMSGWSHCFAWLPTEPFYAAGDIASQLLGFTHYYRTTHKTAGNLSAIAVYIQRLDSGDIELVAVNCPNCHATNDQLLFDRDRYGIPWKTVVCRDCGMVYSNPQMNASSTVEFYVSDLYRRIYGSGHLLRDSTSLFEIDRVDRCRDYHRLTHYDFIIGSGIEFESVAEIGAGGGWNLLPFIEDGKHCVGYDYSPNLVEAGKQQGIDMILEDQRGLIGEYDLIMLKHVLEHVDNPVKQLRELREHISANGHLFIEVPGIVNKIPSIQNAHYHYFSERTLASVIHQSGFKITGAQIIERNGYILVLAKKSDGYAGLVRTSGEHKWVIGIVRRGRIGMMKAFVAERLPRPLLGILKVILRG